MALLLFLIEYHINLALGLRNELHTAGSKHMYTCMQRCARQRGRLQSSRRLLLD